MSEGRRQILVAVLLIVAIVLPLCPSFERPAAAMDEGALLVYPELIVKGHVPYRDFETFYGPANGWVLAAVYAVTGPGLFAERGVGLCYRILLLAAIFALSQRRGTTLAAGCTVIAGMLLIPFGIPAVAWLGALACALWSIWCATKVESTARCLGAGLLAGLVLLFRPDFGPAIMAASLPFFLLMGGDKRWKYLTAAALALSPYIYITILAGPEQVLNNLVLYPVFHSSPGRHIPILSVTSFLLGMFAMHLVAVGLIIGTSVAAIWADRRNSAARLLLSVGLLGLGLTHQAAQRLDLGHMIAAALLSFTFLPVALFVLCRNRIPRLAGPVIALGATALVVLTLQLVVPGLGISNFNRIRDCVSSDVHYAEFIEHRGRSFPVPSKAQATDVEAILQTLETVARPGERLFVGPADLRRTNYNDTFIYYLMPHLQPATYFLEMNPMSANRPGSRLTTDVASADWLVLSHVWDKWDELNESTKFGPEAPMQVVQSQFELMATFHAYDVYRRRTSVASRN